MSAPEFEVRGDHSSVITRADEFNAQLLKALDAVRDPRAAAAHLMELVRGEDGVARCAWGDSTPDYRAYHDTEWGRPVTDDVRLFEKLCLEGFQSGLSWLTILRKREAFRSAFAGFDFERVARYTERDVERLLGDAGDRPPPRQDRGDDQQRAARRRAGRGGGLAVGLRLGLRARPRRATRASRARRPSRSALAKELKRRGWRFVGPTTVYAFMQAMGLVNDHLEGCDARAAVERARAALR